jgi:hypothetical protein
VLSHQLTTVVLDDSRVGVAGVLVDRVEVQNALLGDSVRQHLTSFEVADRLHIDNGSVAKLAKSRALPRVRSSMGGRQFYYSIKDVEHFNSTYASTARIAVAAGVPTAAVAARLRETNVSPALGAGLRSAHFYLITDLMQVYPQPVIERLLCANGGADSPNG